jgi:hypothetical protein
VTDILTSAVINDLLLAKSREVDEAVDEYRAALEDHAVKAREAKRHRSFVTVTMRHQYPKAPAVVLDAYVEQDESIAPVLDAEARALARKEIAKAAWQSKLAQLSAAQSLASSAREEMRLAR